MDIDDIEAELSALADELTAVRPGECLACYLDRLVFRLGCHDHRFTLRWEAAQPRRMPALVRWLQSHGGYCDCEALLNVFGRGARSQKHQRLQCPASYAASRQESW